MRPVGREAEPQVVGLAPKTTNERRTNTMKTYILRDSQTVEPQKSVRQPRTQTIAPAPAKGPGLYIGLDVHRGVLIEFLDRPESFEFGPGRPVAARMAAAGPTESQ